MGQKRYLKIEARFATERANRVKQVSSRAGKISVRGRDENGARDLETVRLRTGPSVVGFADASFGTDKRITGIASERTNRTEIAAG